MTHRHRHEEHCKPSRAVRVVDIMSSPVRTADPGDTIANVHSAMRMMGFRHMPIVDESGRVVGVVSDRDVKRAWTQGGHTLVSEVMSKYVEWIDPTDLAERAVGTLIQRKIGCLPVVDEGSLVGIVTETDFLELIEAVLKVASGEPSRSWSA